MKNSNKVPRAEDVAGRLRVTLPLVTGEGIESIKYTSLEPTETVEAEGETYVLYTIPNPEAQAAQPFLRLRVATEGGLLQEGVFGLALHHSQVKVEWPELKLEPRGVSTRATAQHQSTITL